jgi:hypothetical protein
VNDDPRFTTLTQLLPAEAARQATASIRGYDWQRWLTALNWLSLTGSESLWIEWGEDLTILDSPNARTIQAKSSEARLTLGSAATLKIVETALLRPDSVQTLIWTCGQAGKEIGCPFDDGAIPEWIRVTGGNAEPTALRDFLLTVPAGTDELRKILEVAPDALKLKQLFGKVRWILGEEGVDGLKTQVAAVIEARLATLGVIAPSLKAETIRNLMFEYLGGVSIDEDPQKRMLSREGLERWIALQLGRIIDAGSIERFNRAVVHLSRIDACAPDPVLPPSAAFTLPWYVYSQRSIALTGRESELSRLGAFCDDPRPFLVQLLGGEAGSGKSRLALEFMRSLDSRWLCGFLSKDDMNGFLAELPLAGNQVFVAIDYAGSAVAELGAFLGKATREASKYKIRLRVLLIERDVSKSADWRIAIEQDFSKGSAVFTASLYDKPIELCSLGGSDLDVLKAWLKAAERDSTIVDRLTEDAVSSIVSICQANPLLLGFAAAALDDGDHRFSTVATLLDGLLRRAVRGIDTQNLDMLLDLASVATAARFDFSKPHDDDVFLEERDGGIGLYVIIDADGIKMPLTVGQIRQSAKYDELRQAIARRGEAITAAISETFGTKSATALVRATQKAFGQSCAVVPDLVGEYLLALKWQIPNALEHRVVSGLDATQFSEQLKLSYRLNPFGLLFTLDILRGRDWAFDAYVRAVPEYVKLLRSDPMPQPEWLQTFVTRLLYNSTVRIGGQKPNSAVVHEIVAALQSFAAHWPGNRDISYRLLKAKLNLMRRDGSGHSPETVLSWLNEAALLHFDCVRHANDGFYAAYADAIVQAVKHLCEQKTDPERLATLASVLMSLCSSVDDDELLTITSKALFKISVALSVPDNDDPFDGAQHQFVEKMLGLSTDLFEAFLLKFRNKLGAERTITILKALGNSNFAYAKLGKLPASRRLYRVISKDWTVRGLEAEKCYIETVALWNWIRFGPETDQAKRLLKQCEEVASRCRPYVKTTDYLPSALLQLIVSCLEKAEGRKSYREFIGFLTIAMSVPVNAQDDRAIRTLIDLALRAGSSVYDMWQSDRAGWQRLHAIVSGPSTPAVTRRIIRSIWTSDPTRQKELALPALREQVDAVCSFGRVETYVFQIATFIAHYFSTTGASLPSDFVAGAHLTMASTHVDTKQSLPELHIAIDIKGERSEFVWTVLSLPNGLLGASLV